MLEHFGVARRCSRPGDASPTGSTRQLRRRGIHDERVLAAMARVPRELFVPERAARLRLRGRRAAARRTGRPCRSRSSSRSPARASRSRAASACSTSAPARATRRRCSPSSRREVHSIERIPELAEARARLARRGGLRARAGARRRRHGSACPSTRRTAGSPSRPPRPSVPAGAVGAAPRGRAGSCCRSARAGGRSCARSSGRREGPKLIVARCRRASSRSSRGRRPRAA